MKASLSRNKYKKYSKYTFNSLISTIRSRSLIAQTTSSQNSKKYTKAKLPFSSKMKNRK